jgi:hypothetical protein
MEVVEVQVQGDSKEESRRGHGATSSPTFEGPTVYYNRIDGEIAMRTSTKAALAATTVPESTSPPAPLKAKAAGKPAAGSAISLPPLIKVHTIIKIRGTSPVITHKWSEKAREQIRAKKEGRAQAKRAPCDPEKEFNDAKYIDSEGRDCIPSLAIKGAITNAASFAEGVTKVELRGALFIEGELIPIRYKECEKREDAVRVGNGQADLRYRPAYHEWEADVPVVFNSHVISAEQVHHLFQLAGFSIGICDWRPQRNGQFGRFELANAVEEAA